MMKNNYGTSKLFNIYIKLTWPKAKQDFRIKWHTVALFIFHILIFRCKTVQAIVM
jgi:hypothetical protein